MKFIFAGTSEFAVTSLAAVHSAGHEILCVITQPDKPVGRKKILTPTPVKTYAINNNLNIYQPEKISSEEAINHIKSFGEIDAFIVAAYGQKISTELLYFTKLGTINVHGSILPALRGAAPIQYSLILGMEKTGITTMLMNEGMDTGDMLLTQETNIDPNENYETLSNRLAKIGADLLLVTLDKLVKKEITPIKQNDDLATKAMSLKKKHTLIDFNESALKAHNLIRALNPKPNAICSFNNKTLKLISSKVIENDSINQNSGQIANISKDGIEIYFKQGVLLIEALQLEGSKAMLAYDFALGQHLTTETIFSNFILENN